MKERQLKIKWCAMIISNSFDNKDAILDSEFIHTEKYKELKEQLKIIFTNEEIETATKILIGEI